METLIDLFKEAARKFKNNIYLWEKQNGKYSGTTYGSVEKEVHKVAAAFIANGINKGDRIALLSEGRNNWIISELGILYAGGCCVPLSVRLQKEEIKFRLEHSGCRMAIISGLYFTKFDDIWDRLPGLEKIIVFDIPENLSQRIVSFELFKKDGELFFANNNQLIEERINTITSDDLANISYTSGTTADPKGIMLSHGNYVTNVKQALSLMNIPEYYRTLAILPWDHSFAHTTCLYCFMAMGASVGAPQSGKTMVESLKNIPVNIKELKPHLMMSVPAISKNFRKNIESGIAQKGKIISGLFKFALKIAYLYNGLGNNKGKNLRILLLPLNALFEKILFRKVREGLGGDMKFFIGGGALLDTELQRFFYAIGIPVCQGYGLSEASPVISSNSLANIKFGTSGRIVKFLDLKIVGDHNNELAPGIPGEIVIMGGNVMKGYWNNPRATEDVIRDGWLYTGDMGYIDNDGYLVVLGRFKSLLIGNDGEKYSPEGIEEAIVSNCRFIDQIILYNNQSPYTVGLIIPDISNIRQQLQKEKVTIGTPESVLTSLKLIKTELDQWYGKGKYAGDFPERWLPTAISILPEGFTQHNHCLNSSLKLVRPKIYEYFSRQIEFLYTPEGRVIENDVNQNNLVKWFN
ncbi:MAG TPA: AMP-binding protein [Lentimicrobium sp.]|nr:AMP-binding protein [Lentimicrobium sp.]